MPTPRPAEPLRIERASLVLRLHTAWLQDQGLAGLAREPEALRCHLRQDLRWRRPEVLVYGRRHPVPRLTCWIGDRGCSYRYSGLKEEPQPWTPALRALRERLEAQLGSPFNSLLLNCYRDGLDRMGWHADDEPELAARAPIASLSLGASRTLRFRPRRGGAPPVALELGDGDLLVMEPPTQQHWLHALPVRRRVSGERLNLTFRQIQPG